MKMLNNVLIKITSGGRGDLVLFVDNVPEELFYEMRHPRKAVGTGQQQHWEPDLDKPQVPTLYEELHLSQTGDKGIVFDLDNNQARSRFQQLDRYIKSMTPPHETPVEAIPYAMDPTDASSPALALSQVPRAVLPSLSPREPKDSLRDSGAATSLDVEAIQKKAVADYLDQQNKERMAKVREARKTEEPAAEASK
jgi:hypothetical protein